MVAVVSLSILFNIPRHLDDHVVKREDGSLKRDRTYLGNDDTFQLVYAGIFYYVVIYFLPVLILSAMTHRHVISSSLIHGQKCLVTIYCNATTTDLCVARFLHTSSLHL